MDDFPAVDRISRQAVRMPCQDAVRLPTLDAFEDVIEHWTAGRLCASSFFRYGDDLEMVTFGKSFEFLALRFNRKHLTACIVGGFAAIGKKAIQVFG
jgi:hypothetical protein